MACQMLVSEIWQFKRATAIRVFYFAATISATSTTSIPENDAKSLTLLVTRKWISRAETVSTKV